MQLPRELAMALYNNAPNMVQEVGDVIDINKFLHSPDLLADQQMKRGSAPIGGGFGSKWRDPKFVEQEAARRGIAPGKLQPVAPPPVADMVGRLPRNQTQDLANKLAREMAAATDRNLQFGNKLMSDRSLQRNIDAENKRTATPDVLAPPSVRQVNEPTPQSALNRMAKDYIKEGLNPIQAYFKARETLMRMFPNIEFP